MSLLMDALKRADAAKQETTITAEQKKRGDSIDWDKELLLEFTVDSDSPTTSVTTSVPSVNIVNEQLSPLSTEQGSLLNTETNAVDSNSEEIAVVNPTGWDKEILTDYQTVASVPRENTSEATNTVNPVRIVDWDVEIRSNRHDTTESDLLTQITYEEAHSPVTITTSEIVNSFSELVEENRNNIEQVAKTKPTVAQDYQDNSVLPSTELDNELDKHSQPTQYSDDMDNNFEPSPIRDAHPDAAQRVFDASDSESLPAVQSWLYILLGIVIAGMCVGYYFLNSYVIALSNPGLATSAAKSTKSTRLQNEPMPQSVAENTIRTPINPLPAVNRPETGTSVTTPVEPRSPIIQGQANPAVNGTISEPVQPKPVAPPITTSTTQLPALPPKRKLSSLLPATPQTKPLAAPQAGVKLLQKSVTPLSSEANQAVLKAYTAFQQGDDMTAQTAYMTALQHDPRHRDALLGLAALGIRQQNFPAARYYYQQILKFYPQDAVAQVGLATVATQYSTDPNQPTTERLTSKHDLERISQLKSLVQTQAKEATGQTPQLAYIYFNLGNLYSQQGQWTQAQQAYFDAYRYDNSGADYAYNLAVSLEHLHQPRLAINYYEKALQLIDNKLQSSYNFDPQTIRRRLQTLSNHARNSTVVSAPNATSN